MTTPKRARSKRKRPTPPPLPKARSQWEQLPVAFWVGIGIASMLFMVIGLGVLYFSLTGGDPNGEVADDSKDSTEDRTGATFAASNQSRQEILSPLEKARRAAARNISEDEAEKVVKNNPLTPEPKKEKTIPWDQSLIRLDGKLPLPELTENSFLTQTKETRKPLVKIHVENPDEIDLAILSHVGSSKEIGAEGSELEGFIVEPSEDADEDATTRKWIVKRKSFPPLQAVPLPEKFKVGTFKLADEKLTFDWNRKTAERSPSKSLRYCLLEISKGDEKRLLQLFEPKKSDPLRFKQESLAEELVLDVNNRNAVEDPGALRSDLSLEGIDGETFSKKGMKPGDSVRFAAKNRKLRHGDPNIEFEIKFEMDGKKDAKLVLTTYTTRKEIKPLTSAEDTRELDKVAIKTVTAPTMAAHFSKFKTTAKKNLDKIEESAQYSEAKKRLSMLKEKIKDLRSKLDEEKDDVKQESIKQEIAQLENREEFEIEKRHDVTREIIHWCDDMEAFFEKLEKSAQIGYTVYTQMQGERIDLTQAGSQEKSANIKSKSK